MTIGRMRRSKSIRWMMGCLVGLSLFFVCLSGTYAQMGSRGVLVIGDDLDYPPYSYLDEQGEPAGFNIEIARAVALEQGYIPEFRLAPWADTVAALDAGEIDVIAGMFYSPERFRRYDFTVRHTVASGDIFARKGTAVSGISDLAGKTVVVQDGDILHEYMARLDPALEITVLAVPTVTEALRRVASEEYDYAALLKAPANFRIQDGNIGNVEGTGMNLVSSDYAMAVPKGQDTLLDQLNEGLLVLNTSGRYGEIYDQWLGVYEGEELSALWGRVLWILGLLALVAAMSIAWTIVLRRQVRTRTSQLAWANGQILLREQGLRAANRDLLESNAQLKDMESELRVRYQEVLLSQKRLLNSEDRNQAIIRAQPDLLFIFDQQGQYLDCLTRNPSNMTYTREMLLNKNVQDVLPPAAGKRVLEAIQKALVTQVLQTVEYQLTEDSGDKIFEMRISPSSQNTVVGFARDVTWERSAKRILGDEKELLKTTLRSLGEGVITTDAAGRVTLLNRMAERLTGWNEKEAISKNFEDIFFVTREDTGARVSGLIGKAMQLKEPVGSLSGVILHNQEGKKIHLSTSYAAIHDMLGKAQGAVVVFRDVTRERSYLKQIEFLSYRDQLTGIYNRRYFTEQMEAIDTADNLPISLILADVNGLKLTNDAFGHKLGDQLLVEVSSILQRFCRPQDVVARLGGDEFIILMPKMTAQGTEQIIRVMKEATSRRKVASVELSISFGYASKHSEADDLQELFNSAEDMMYKNKLFEGPSMRGKTIGAIINTLHEKNEREEDHSHRVAELCESMGRALNLLEGDLQELKTVGLLHDIGKVAINEAILNKPDALTDEEREEIQRHPEIGYRILSSVNDMAEMAEIVLCHHERWDGTGYPKGMAGEEIPFVSRIVHLADSFDAMVSERAYREGMPLEWVIEEIRKGSGTQFDPNLTGIFLEQVVSRIEKTPEGWVQHKGIPGKPFFDMQHPGHVTYE